MNQSSLSNVALDTYDVGHEFSFMCQTESVALLKASSSLRLAQVIKTRESRLWSKQSLSSFLFGTDNPALKGESESKVTIPMCRLLSKVPSGMTFIDAPYRDDVFVPWLMAVLTTLDSYSCLVKGPNRDRIMIEWIKMGALSAECVQLDSLLERCSRMSTSSIVEMVEVIKRAGKITKESQRSQHLRKLLSFSGVSQGEQMHSSFNQLLECYQQVSSEDLTGNDAQIKHLVRKFIRQSPQITSTVLSVSRNTVFIGLDSQNNETVLCLPLEDGSESNHLRLLCCLNYAFERWIEDLGPDDGPVAIINFDKSAVPREKNFQVAYVAKDRDQRSVHQEGDFRKRGKVFGKAPEATQFNRSSTPYSSLPPSSTPQTADEFYGAKPPAVLSKPATNFKGSAKGAVRTLVLTAPPHGGKVMATSEYISLSSS